MAELMTTDVRTLLDRDPFDASAVADLREVLGRDPSRYATLREAVGALRDRTKGSLTPDVHLRLGVGDVLLGKYASGLENLGKVPEQGMAQFFRGLALEYLQKWPEAGKAFEAASAAGYDAKLSDLHRAGALRRGGNPDEARKMLDSLEKSGSSSAEYHYQRGSLLAAEGELVQASAELERAIELDRHHTNALFELAYINDLHGNDEVALDFYKDCIKRPPVPLAALINLGVLYEDRMNFRRPRSATGRSWRHDRTHPRASLFFKDCRASRDMFYDETVEKDIAIKRQLMEIPVTDFELSVRSRNCLRKMNIRTLGDLTRTTEAALLASKNFGETSLSEIKEMMTSKNLWLGMALEGGGQVSSSTHEEPESLSAEDRAMLAKPIGDLNLSVRARKCMTKLGINTMGELLIHTGDELLECKNFGVTSLNEVREKLRELNLKLKNE